MNALRIRNNMNTKQNMCMLCIKSFAVAGGPIVLSQNEDKIKMEQYFIHKASCLVTWGLSLSFTTGMGQLTTSSQSISIYKHHQQHKLSMHNFYFHKKYLPRIKLVVGGLLSSTSDTDRATWPVETLVQTVY